MCTQLLPSASSKNSINKRRARKTKFLKLRENYVSVRENLCENPAVYECLEGEPDVPIDPSPGAILSPLVGTVCSTL